MNSKDKTEIYQDRMADHFELANVLFHYSKED